MNDNYRIRKKTDHLEVDVVGDRDFVVEQFERLWEEPQALAGETIAAHVPSPAVMALGEYVNQSGARTNNEVTLAVAGYHFRNGDKTQFTTQDIKDGFNEILRPIPGNTSQAIADLVKQGLVMKRGKIEGTFQYSITQTGLKRLDEGFSRNKK